VPGCGETGHVKPDLGDDRAGRGGAGTGDLIQSGHRPRERGDQLLDPFVDHGDVRVDGVDMGEHAGRQEPVMSGEPAGERLPQLARFGAHP
jgi:hypothetical protein